VNLAASELGLNADALQVLDAGQPATIRIPLPTQLRLFTTTGAEPVADDCLPPGSYR